MLRMCAVLLNYYKRQLLAVLPQFNFSLLQGYSIHHDFALGNAGGKWRWITSLCRYIRSSQSRINICQHQNCTNKKVIRMHAFCVAHNKDDQACDHLFYWVTKWSCNNLNVHFEKHFLKKKNLYRWDYTALTLTLKLSYETHMMHNSSFVYKNSLRFDTVYKMRQRCNPLNHLITGLNYIG